MFAPVRLSTRFSISLSTCASSTCKAVIFGLPQAHRQGSTSAPETDFVQELKQDLEFVSSIEGSAQKKQVALYCRRLGIDYTKPTDVEFEAMMRVLQKSRHLKNPGKKQGRKKRK